MGDSKRGLRALCLALLAAVSMMVFVAAAQAQTGWLENKAFITEDKPFQAVVHPLVGGAKHLALDTTLAGGTTIEILCEVLTTSGGTLLGTEVALREKAEGKGTLEFKECQTFLNKALSNLCKPKEPILTKTKFKAILHTSGDKKTYILFEPEVGTTFANILFANEECVLAPNKPVTGALVAECLNSKLEKNTAGTDYCLEDAVHHYIQEAPTKLFELGVGTGKFHELLFGARPANLLGIADVIRGGVNTWGVHI
jgi:hypothetical protein